MQEEDLEACDYYLETFIHNKMLYITSPRKCKVHQLNMVSSLYVSFRMLSAHAGSTISFLFMVYIAFRLLANT